MNYSNNTITALAVGLGLASFGTIGCSQKQERQHLTQPLSTPFDQDISPGNEGNARVPALVIGLQAQEQILFEVFEAFGLTVEIPE